MPATPDALDPRRSANLDRPPPSPSLAPETASGFKGLAAPVTLAPSDASQASMAIRKSLLQALETMDQQISAMARTAPTLAPRFDRILDQIRSVSGALLVEGLTATDETNPGPGFPGGGFARGA